MWETMTKKKKQNLLVGITGGMGAGKSKIAQFFSAAGYTVLSADNFARKITAAGAPALAEVLSIFGPKSILPSGEMDRAYVRQEITRDATLRTKLEAITHPKIQALTIEESKKLFAAGKAIVFYEAPLLFEAKTEKNLDFVICVIARDDLRVQRIMARDHCSQQAAEKLMRSQMPQEEKAKKSDFVVENNGSEAELQDQAQKILDALQQLVPAS